MSVLAGDYPQAAQQKWAFREIFIKQMTQVTWTEFMAKTVSEETEKTLYALLANWLVRTGMEGESESAGGRQIRTELHRALKEAWM